MPTDQPTSDPSQTLEKTYRAYIDTLNAEDWSTLKGFLSPTVVIHNGNPLNHLDYRNLIFPNTHFEILDLVIKLQKDGQGSERIKGRVAARLDITIDGTKRVREHCFYEWVKANSEDVGVWGDQRQGLGERWVIREVWSMWEEVKL